MPTNKDLKRLVRVRMKKTGEAYTAARAQILRKKPALQAVSPKPQKTQEYSELAGMRDDAVKEKTGRTWAAWVRTLDRAGALAWPHGKIARYVHEALGVPGWWSQTVTVGYERIKGLRAIGQRMDGSFEASKSRTFSVPVARLYTAWKDPRVRAKWLPGVALTVRKAVPEKSMRITWPDGTSVEAWFVSKGAAKSQVALAHAKLGSKADADGRRAYWEDRLRILGDVLTVRK
jgi:hypothetical protein